MARASSRLSLSGFSLSEAPSRNRAEFGTDIADGDEPQLWQSRLVERRRSAVGGCVRPARHPRSDYCNTDRR
jgi:hypothetical protein